jgi:hypothetical protein
MLKKYNTLKYETYFMYAISTCITIVGDLNCICCYMRMIDCFFRHRSLHNAMNLVSGPSVLYDLTINSHSVF